MNIKKYTDTIESHYGETLVGYQLIHEQDEVYIYVVYIKNGKMDIVRLFPNYFTRVIDVSVDRKMPPHVDLSNINLPDLMYVVESIVNTLKGEN